MSQLKACIAEVTTKAQEAKCKSVEHIANFNNNIQNSDITDEALISLIRQNIHTIPPQHLENIGAAISNECAALFQQVMPGGQPEQADEGL